MLKDPNNLADDGNMNYNSCFQKNKLTKTQKFMATFNNSNPEEKEKEELTEVINKARK